MSFSAPTEHFLASKRIQGPKAAFPPVFSSGMLWVLLSSGPGVLSHTDSEAASKARSESHGCASRAQQHFPAHHRVHIQSKNQSK